MRKVLLFFAILYFGQAFSQSATTSQLRDSMAVIRSEYRRSDRDSASILRADYQRRLRDSSAAIRAEYRRALSDSMAAIRAFVQTALNRQSVRDNLQDTTLAKLDRESLTFYDYRFFDVVGNTVYLKMDSISAYSGISRLDLRIDSVNNKLVPIDIRLRSLEGWRTLAQGDIDFLKSYADRLRKTVFIVPQTTLPFPQ